MRAVWSAVAIALAVDTAAIAQLPLPEIPEHQKQELVGYLTENWMTPEDYVASKFTDRDIVFLGECHRIKHQVEFLHALIPRLYAIGVYDLGIEFGTDECQDSVDVLINAASYDEGLARRILFRFDSNWPFVEYEDVYRKAWELNHSLPPDAPRFRVTNLNYRPRWDLATENMAAYDSVVFDRGTDDSVMARHVLDEFVKKGRKALIYCGMHHAFTRYRQPRLSGGHYNGRLGNIISDSIPSRVFSISLHWPWMQRRNLEEVSYPTGGVIDAVMREFERPRLGFDVIGSPFATLTDTATYYSIGYSPFVLADFCDGYIYQRPFSEYEGCTVDSLFVTEANFEEAVRFYPNVTERAAMRSPEDLMRRARKSANFRAMFPMLR